MRRALKPVIILVVAILLGCIVSAQTFTDPAEAGPDFAIQGEYSGNTGDRKLGIQVIALGNATFQAVFHPGGLPGDGWDSKTRVRVEGKTEAHRTRFGAAGNGWNGSIAGENFTGHTDQGVEFSAPRVLRRSPTLGAPPPEGAVVLFDGTGVDAWQNGRLTDDRLLQVGTSSKQRFGDCAAHLEFRTPFSPAARGQGRGNSGVYLQGRYEVQVLDSFGLDGRSNECGGLYGRKAPDVNMCFPPLSWQTYDIEFRAARVDENGQAASNPTITVRHNGVLIHKDVELKPVGGENGQPGPIHLQNHGNPVHYRNIWVVERK